MECGYYKKIGQGVVECTLCPHGCQVKNGRYGLCSVRFNDNGVFRTDNYGLVSSIALDPVEKKPLYHFFPGKNILSIGSFGCNFTCHFCQNHEISQVNTSIGRPAGTQFSVDQIINRSLAAEDNIGIAFTYNEPTVWIEYMLYLAIAAVDNNQKSVMITNGYINPGPLNDLITLVDAFNVDLKAFNESFYRKYSGATLKPVLNTIEFIASAGKHLEITMLIIEGINDDLNEFTEAVKWIAGNTGSRTPLHLSRYFPRHLMTEPPTRGEKLAEMKNIADEFLDFVYIGNLHSGPGQDTICPGCGNRVTTRSGYNTTHISLNDHGGCAVCGESIYRDFTF